MRLIDIKNIEDTYKSIKSYLREYTPSHHTDAMIGGMKRLMTEINNIEPTITCCKTIGNWIPVSKRLPDIDTEYYVTWTTSTKSKPFVGIWEYECDEGFIVEDYARHYNDVKVVAWMPLPNPYMGGKNE